MCMYVCIIHRYVYMQCVYVYICICVCMHASAHIACDVLCLYVCMHVRTCKHTDRLLAYVITQAFPHQNKKNTKKHKETQRNTKEHTFLCVASSSTRTMNSVSSLTVPVLFLSNPFVMRTRWPSMPVPRPRITGGPPPLPPPACVRILVCFL